jgi:hypothetical protein
MITGKPFPGASTQEGARDAHLFAQQHMTASILLIADFVVLGTEWAILPI